MSVLNVLLNPDRLLVAVDTLAEDAQSGQHSAGRGSAQFFLKLYELAIQASF